MATEELTIGEVARRSGVAASALRFYEERGLVSSDRAGSGHRRYPRSVLRRVAFIVFAQRIGLTLDEIGDELAKLPPDRAPTRRDWSRLSSGWGARIDERIAELERLKAGLTECIGCGCLSLERCKLANPGDRAAADGPWPPLLDRRPAAQPPELAAGSSGGFGASPRKRSRRLTARSVIPWIGAANSSDCSISWFVRSTDSRACSAAGAALPVSSMGSRGGILGGHQHRLGDRVQLLGSRFIWSANSCIARS